MTPEQALQAGAAFAKSHLAVIEAAYGVEVACAYAGGYATNARDYMRANEGEEKAAFWFICLGHDSITQPEGA